MVKSDYSIREHTHIRYNSRLARQLGQVARSGNMHTYTCTTPCRQDSTLKSDCSVGEHTHIYDTTPCWQDHTLKLDRSVNTHTYNTTPCWQDSTDCSVREHTHIRHNSLLARRQESTLLSQIAEYTHIQLLAGKTAQFTRSGNTHTYTTQLLAGKTARLSQIARSGNTHTYTTVGIV